jgi:hypothetical protein
VTPWQLFTAVHTAAAANDFATVTALLDEAPADTTSGALICACATLGAYADGVTLAVGVPAIGERMLAELIRAESLLEATVQTGINP